MKKLMFVAALALLGTLSLSQLSAQESDRAQRKEQQAAENMENFNLAVQAIKNQNFVLEAQQVQLGVNSSTYVVSQNNFVLMDGNQGMVQLAFNNGNPGLNGAGGVTVAGQVSGISMNTDKKGNVMYQFDINGNGISGTVVISLPYGSSYATANVTSTFNNSLVIFRGNIIPGSQSNVFKAQPFQNIPIGLVR